MPVITTVLDDLQRILISVDFRSFVCSNLAYADWSISNALENLSKIGFISRCLDSYN